jgi:hypothetical protein
MSGTGRWVVEQGKDCTISALYLMTCPNANMIGLYYLPIVTMSHETGLSVTEARGSLRRLSEAPSEGLGRGFEGGFAWFDEPSSVVWVPQMAKFQIGPTMNANDNQVKAIRKEVERWKKHRFFVGFYGLYNGPYNLGLDPPLVSPFEGPSKGLRSQEQEQEQEQKQEQEDLAGGSSPARPVVETGLTSEPESPRTPAPVQGSRPAAQGSLLPAELALAPAAKPAPRPKSPKQQSATALTWEAYADAYEGRHGTAPEKNGEVMGKLSTLVSRVGQAQAPILARYYLTRNDARYSYHPVGLLLSDYQKLLTAMKTGRVVTETTARANERTASNPGLAYVAELEAELAAEQARKGR